MNTRRIIFWVCFLIILALIIWGLAASMSRPIAVNGVPAGSPAPVSTTDHVKASGSAGAFVDVNAQVTLIEYSDFQCPACENYYYFVEKLLQDEPTSTVRFIYRYFPLPQHANAIPSAMATEAAGLQGKFWDMYSLIFKNHADWTELTDPTSVFVGYATTLGLDTAKFTADLKNATSTSVVQADLASGQVAGIDSTPTFFVNGKAIANQPTYADFKKLIDQAASAGSQ